ncbi:MAG: hypothetical protein ACI4KH_09460 [Oscillospiraceae bacterium]
MKKEEFCLALNEIDDEYVKGAREKMKETRKINFKMIGAVAACLCVIGMGTVAVVRNADMSVSTKPNPIPIEQVVNPMMEVSSVEEMEKYLDFKVPVIDKEVSNYFVFVFDGYPEMAQINYADGTEFRKKYGSEDISGINGGTLIEEKEIGKVKVSFYEYKSDGYEVSYAIWEKDGFSYSLSGSGDLESEIAKIIG